MPSPIVKFSLQRAAILLAHDDVHVASVSHQWAPDAPALCTRLAGRPSLHPLRAGAPRLLGAL